MSCDGIIRYSVDADRLVVYFLCEGLASVIYETFCYHASLDVTISVRCADQDKCILDIIRQSHYQANILI